jgi:hypothetical protein
MILEKYLEIAYGLKEKQWSKILQGSILSLLYYLVYFSLLRLCKDKILNKGKFFKSMAEIGKGDQELEKRLDQKELT